MKQNISKEVNEHFEKYGPILNYVTFPYGNTRIHVLTPNGKEKLDGDTLLGHIEIKTLQKETEELRQKLAKVESDRSKLVECVEALCYCPVAHPDDYGRVCLSCETLKEIKGEE